MQYFFIGVFETWVGPFSLRAPPPDESTFIVKKSKKRKRSVKQLSRIGEGKRDSQK
jgi:hypothetical protein